MPGLTILPIADGTIDALDRRQAGGIYPFVSVAPPSPLIGGGGFFYYRPAVYHWPWPVEQPSTVYGSADWRLPFLKVHGSATISGPPAPHEIIIYEEIIYEGYTEEEIALEETEEGLWFY